RGLRARVHGRGGDGRGARRGGGAQRRDVVGVQVAVDRAAVLALELLDGVQRAAAELAVDGDVVARVAEQVLQDADVVPVHALLDRDAVAEALRAAALAADGGGGAAVGDVRARALRGRLQGGEGLAADRPARRGLGGALEALDGAHRGRTELPVGLHPEARAAQGLLQFLDVRAAGADPEGAVAEVRPRRPLRDGGRCGDGSTAQGGGEDRYENTTTGRRHDGWNPLFRAPTGLAVGLARKGPRYAVRERRFAPGHRGGLWVPRLRPVGPEGVRLVTTTRATYTSCRRLCLLPHPIPLHAQEIPVGRGISGAPESGASDRSCRRQSPSTRGGIASATRARGRSPEASRTSCGAWAPPPSGPSPSTVSGIDGAKWLA